MNRLVVLFLTVIAVVAATKPMICGFASLTPDNPAIANVTGHVTFIQNERNGPVRVVGTIQGLSEGLHGFHVHEKGNLREGCISAGPHFNPHRVSHGGRASFERHVGDLGNIEANANGKATIDFWDNQISLSASSINNILSRTIVVHSDEDDLGEGHVPESKTTGNSGSRVACGVIGIL